MRRKRPYARRPAKPAEVVPVAEKDVLKSILDFLSTIHACKAWRNNVGAFRVEKRFIRFSPVGSSDVFAIIRGRFVSIEVKAPGKVPSETQRQWLQECADAGACAFYTDNLDDLIRELRDAGLIR